MKSAKRQVFERSETADRIPQLQPRKEGPAIYNSEVKCPPLPPKLSSSHDTDEDGEDLHSSLMTIFGSSLMTIFGSSLCLKQRLRKSEWKIQPTLYVVIILIRSSGTSLLGCHCIPWDGVPHQSPQKCILPDYIRILKETGVQFLQQLGYKFLVKKEIGIKVG